MRTDLPKLSADQKTRLKAFTANGGIIIRAEKRDPGVAARAEAAAGGARINLDPHGYVLGQLTRMHDGRTLILHLLNYDQVLSENVKVRLDLSGLVPDPSSLELKVLSPDEIRPQLADLSVRRNVIEFTLRRIEHYTVVTFSDKAAP